MSSEIRTNLLKSRTGLSTVTLSDTGPVVTGIATFGVTTKIDGGNNVINVGTALTIGHTQGVQFHTQNLHSTGFEVNQVNASGIITASSYRGDGSQLTGISVTAGLTTDAQGNTKGGANAGANFDGTNAQSNTLIGNNAGNDITTGDYNTCVGALAGDQITVNGYHTYIGYNAGGADQCSGYGRNTAIGANAGQNIRSSYGAETNTAIGANCYTGNSGSKNVYVGAFAGGSCGGPESSNVAIGYETLRDTESAVNNCVAIGQEALEIVERPNNVAIGYRAGRTLGHGENNIIIGTNAEASSTTADNEITLGDANITKLRVPGLGYVNDAGKVGIGTITPGTTLHLSSATPAIRLTDTDTAGPLHCDIESASGDLYLDTGSVHRDVIITSVGKTNEIARFTGDGQVGIGTNAPASNMNLHVLDPTDRCYVTFESGGNESSQISLKNPARTWKISNYYDQNALTFTDDSDERLRIKSDGTIAIPAQGSSNSAPRISFESAVDSNHFTFSQYEDSNGTYTLLGQNIVLNSSGNTVVSDSGHKTAGIFFDGRNHGALTFMTGGTNAYQQSVKIYENRSISIGNVDNFGQYNSSTQNTSGGSALLVDITNGATSASYTTMVRLRGGASGYVHASLNLCATSDENSSGNYRGLGIYMNDEAANNEWYAGRPYASSNQYMISYVGTVNAPYAASASTGNAKLMIQTNGNYNFSGSNTSDRDLKENITTLSGTSLDKIIQLTPKTFNFKPQICETPEGYPSPPPIETPETKTGFIAQEVQSVIPSIVNGTDGQKDMGIDYNGLVAHMVNAIKEQQQQIEILKQENTSLRIRVTNLEDN